MAVAGWQLAGRLAADWLLAGRPGGCCLGATCSARGHAEGFGALSCCAKQVGHLLWCLLKKGATCFVQVTQTPLYLESGQVFNALPRAIELLAHFYCTEWKLDGSGLPTLGTPTGKTTDGSVPGPMAKPIGKNDASPCDKCGEPGRASQRHESVPMEGPI